MGLGTTVVFPSDYVNPEIKKSEAYALEYSQAVWGAFGGFPFYNQRRSEYTNLRRWAEGLQDTSAFVDYFSTYEQGDTVPAGLDYSPISVVAEITDRVVKMILKLPYDIRVEAIDKFSLSEKDNYIMEMKAKMKLKELDKTLKENLGGDYGLFHDDTYIPDTREELDIFANLQFRLATEVAYEGALNYVFSKSGNETIKRDVVQNLVILKYAGTEVDYDSNGEPQVSSIDPVVDITPFPYYEDHRDIKYRAQIKYLDITQVNAEANGQLSMGALNEIQKKYKLVNPTGQMLSWKPAYYPSYFNQTPSGSIPVLKLQWLSLDTQDYQLRKNRNGDFRFEELGFGFNPMNDLAPNREHIRKMITHRYQATWVIGTNYVYNFGLAPNQIFPRRKERKELTSRLTGSYVAPNFRDLQNRSHVHRMMFAAKQMQGAAMKMQAEIQAATPTGYEIDVTGVMELFLGQGQANGNQAKKTITEALRAGKLFTTKTNDDGSGKGQSAFRTFGGLNAGSIEGYMRAYQFWKNELYGVIGGQSVALTSSPDKDTLNGVQQIAAAGTDNSLGTLIDAYKDLMERTATLTSDMIQSSLDTKTLTCYSRALGEGYSKIIEIGSDYSLMEMGIFVEFGTTEDEKRLALQQIDNMAAQGLIDPDDVFMLKTQALQNPKMAAYYLKEKKRQKVEQERKTAELNSKYNQEQQINSAKAAAEGQMQIDQAKAQSEIAVNHQKSQDELGLSMAQNEMDMDKIVLEKYSDMVNKMVETGQIAPEVGLQMITSLSDEFEQQPNQPVQQ